VENSAGTFFIFRSCGIFFEETKKNGAKKQKNPEKFLEGFVFFFIEFPLEIRTEPRQIRDPARVPKN